MTRFSGVPRRTIGKQIGDCQPTLARMESFTVTSQRSLPLCIASAASPASVEAVGGIIDLVEDGDRIAIWIPNRRIELKVSTDVLADGRVTRKRKATMALRA